MAEAPVIEYRVKDRFQSVEQRLLADPIVNRRDTERTVLARLAGLRDQVAQHRLRSIGIGAQLILQSLESLIELLLKLSDALAIHTARTPILPNLRPGQLQVLSLIHLIHQ